MIDYQPGDSVIAARAIVCGPVTVEQGTPGIVEWAYPNMARVLFVGHLSMSNVPVDWLARAVLAFVAESQS
jgi:hypothetical protein